MKRKISIFLIVGFVVILCALTTLAQTEEQKDQLLFVNEFTVKPSMVKEFEACLKEFVALSTQHKHPYSSMVYSLNDFHYLIVFPLEDYADITSWDKAVEELGEKAGKEQWQELSKRVANCYEYYNSSMVYLVPELSYTPENPRLKSGEGNFIFWDIYYLHPGRVKEFKELQKKMLSLFKSKKITEGFNTLSGDIGTDNPVYAYTLIAKDATDFYTHNKKMWEMLGKEGEMLYEKMLPFIRKNEVKQGWFRPDLSYKPEEK
jgi:hypothetical protein